LNPYSKWQILAAETLNSFYQTHTQSAVNFN